MKPVTILSIMMMLLLTQYGCKKNNVVQETNPPSGDYFPLNSGSNWHYQPANNLTGISMNSEITGLSKSLGGHTYSILKYTPGNTRVSNLWDSSLFRKQDGKYYQAITNEELFFKLDEPGIFEFVFMEDNVPVGTTWNASRIKGTCTFSSGSLPMEQSYTSVLREYIPSFKLDETHSFSDVVRIEIFMTAVGYGPNRQVEINDSEKYEMWYARNVGLIKAIHSLGHNNPDTFAISITDFRIN